MIAACLIVLIVLVTLCIGYYLGYFHVKVMTILKKLNNPVEKVEVGPTPGLYHTPNENKAYNDIDKKVGAVMPKTPQVLEWEEQERIRKMNEASV